MASSDISIPAFGMNLAAIGVFALVVSTISFPNPWVMGASLFLSLVGGLIWLKDKVDTMARRATLSAELRRQLAEEED